MPVSALCPFSPPAERARSILAAATSSTVHTPEQRVELMSRHEVEPTGRIELRAAARGLLVAEIEGVLHGDLPAVLELTDLAPVAVPDRVRGKIAVPGWLTRGVSKREGMAVLHFEPAEIELAWAGEMTEIQPEEFAAARPDPLARAEAEVLLHLCDAHPEVLGVLSRLLDPRDLQAVVRIQPVALDRYGLVLRLERPGGYRDARLSFPTPLAGSEDVASALRGLLTRAQRCRGRRRLVSET